MNLDVQDCQLNFSRELKSVGSVKTQFWFHNLLKSNHDIVEEKHHPLKDMRGYTIRVGSTPCGRPPESQQFFACGYQFPVVLHESYEGNNKLKPNLCMILTLVWTQNSG